MQTAPKIQGLSARRAPADPLLMEYARSWSVAEPYLLRPREITNGEDSSVSSSQSSGLNLPMEAVDDGVGQVIHLKTPQLPRFLQR